MEFIFRVPQADVAGLGAQRVIRHRVRGDKLYRSTKSVRYSEPTGERQNEHDHPNASRKTSIASDRALQIARLDAEKRYKDLSCYRITLTLESDGWHVDYELKDENQNGGGPHYVLDAVTGVITSKKYEQ
jgi:hypothetical protein